MLAWFLTELKTSHYHDQLRFMATLMTFQYVKSEIKLN